MNKIYLDHAATTPLNPLVAAAMQPYFGDDFANPSSLYGAARSTRLAVETARAGIADVLGAKTTEIIFTSGGTEGDNLAVQGVLRAAGPGAHWVTTAIEHDAVLSQTGRLDRQGYPSSIVDVGESGIVTADAVEAAINDSTVLVSVMLANNEIGTIQPVADVARAIQRIRLERVERGIDTPIYLHTDACQAAGYLSLHVTRLGVDLMTINGSKIYGPKGVGVLYVRHGVELEPLMYGGGQERGRRSGTENVAGIVGLATALKLVHEVREIESRRLSALRDMLIGGIREALPDVILNGDPKRRLPNNVNVIIPGVEGEAVVLYLDNAGIMVSTGSACSSGSLEPSHVLTGIGRSREAAQQSLRLTLGQSSDEVSIRKVLGVLPGIVARLREIG
jgi:cysteine desulfurase